MNVAFFLKPKSEVAFLYDDYSIRQGLEKMCYHRYAAIPVLNREGKYIGTVSEGDFLWYVISGENTENGKHFQVKIEDYEKVKVKDIIKKEKNPSVKITEDMEKMLNRAMEQNYIPVVDDRDFFIGIITRRDIIKYYCKK